jgi:hypothetical protein
MKESNDLDIWQFAKGKVDRKEQQSTTNQRNRFPVCGH